MKVYSIRTQLTAIILAAITIVTATIGAIVVYSDLRSLRDQIVADTRTVTTVLAQDLVRLLLLDSADLGADIDNKLKGFSHIDDLAVYSESGKLVFVYHKGVTSPAPELARPVEFEPVFGDTHLTLFQPLLYESNRFGTVYVRSTLVELNERTQNYFQFLAILVVVAVLASVFIAILFQRLFAGPIVRLAEVAGRISADSDLSVRFNEKSSHEFNMLQLGFNSMLDSLHRAQSSLREEKDRLNVIFDSIADGVITTNSEGKIEYINPMAQRMTGWSRIAAAGKPLSEVYPIMVDSQLISTSDGTGAYLNLLSDPRHLDHTTLITRSGSKMPIRHAATSITDNDSNVGGTVVVFSNISETREMAQQLGYQAAHDNLTGLMNRNELEHHLYSLLELGANNSSNALLYIDLDQFKVVNDTCGHAAGDQLLRDLATSLKKVVRSGDAFARLGGDEFGLLLRNCPFEGAIMLAEKIRERIDRFRFSWEGKVFRVGASIGLVRVDPTLGNVADLMSAADVACYTAKDKGRNQIYVYELDDKELAQRRGEMDWVSRLDRAFEDSLFRLHMQSIVPLKHGDKRKRYEMLVRMLGDDGELIMPGAFLPAAERYNIIDYVDRWVVENSLREYPDIARRNRGGVPTAININVSALSLGQRKFTEFVAKLLASSNLPAGAICFELTETAAISNLVQAMEFFSMVKKFGCEIALDDFGSGLSSFGYLKQLPVDYVKIDGSFVREIVNDPIDKAMVSAINQIGHQMGLATIAEFVENEDTVNALRDIGVDYAQGNYFGRPAAVVPEPAANVSTMHVKS